MHDFYSDTKTKPGRAMREAMLAAEVGDEQKGEDPTTRRLEQRVAGILGKEAALFLPSGTMCNQIAVAVHCAPGDEIICDRTCHIINSEGGAAAALWGVMVHPLDGEAGVYTPDQVRAAIRSPSRYAPPSRLLCTEQTANLAGGAVWPLEALEAVAEVAKAAGLATHMDGARLLNAAVKTGIAARDYAAGFDSVWLDFSKGLGAPVGAVLAGPRAFIDRAWGIKQRLGGAMRQSGVLAAMCLYALDHHVERLAEDHALAATIATRLAQLPGVARVLSAPTNIVIFDLAAEAPDAATLAQRMRAEGLIVGQFGPRRIRVVTHRDVDAAAGEALCAAFARHLGGA